MLQEFTPGDVLVFQLESGYALMRVLAVEVEKSETVWHVATYSDLFLDVESAESALANIGGLSLSSPHIALTNRAFESTQVAKIAHVPLTEEEISPLNSWRADHERLISDRSVRLMLGLR